MASLWNIVRTVADLLSAAIIGTNETAFATSITINANTLIAGVAYRLTVPMSWTTSAAAPTARLRLRLTDATGTILYDTGAQGPGNSFTGQPAAMEFYLLGSAAAGAAAPVYTHHVGRSNHNLEGSTSALAQPINVPTNADMVLRLTIQYSANTAGNTATVDGMILEQIDGNA